MQTQTGGIVCMAFLGICLTLPWVPSAQAEITFETGDGPHELYFLWQGSFSQAGALSGNLLDMPAFKVAYDKGMLETMEVLEVREFDTDQVIDFNYVSPRRASAPKMREIVWYYPNPIPSGGRARVQIRGRLTSGKIYSGTDKKIDISYEAGEDVFVIIPYGFAVTYCNTPIVVYEKNARTVCSFKAGALAIRAKDVRTEQIANLGPTISRDALSSPIVSTVPVSVVPCEVKAVLDAAPARLAGSVPVVFKGLQDNSLAPEHAAKLKPGETLIWKVNKSVVNGAEGFRAIIGGLQIGTDATLELAEVDPNKGLVVSGNVAVPVKAAKQ